MFFKYSDPVLQEKAERRAMWLRLNNKTESDVRLEINGREYVNDKAERIESEDEITVFPRIYLPTDLKM